jgi:hypothetical protein
MISKKKEEISKCQDLRRALYGYLELERLLALNAISGIVAC